MFIRPDKQYFPSFLSLTDIEIANKVKSFDNDLILNFCKKVLSTPNRDCGGKFAFVGFNHNKSIIAKKIAEAINLPFVQINLGDIREIVENSEFQDKSPEKQKVIWQARMVLICNNIILQTAAVLEKTIVGIGDIETSLELMPIDNNFIVPPCVVLINDIDTYGDNTERLIQELEENIIHGYFPFHDGYSAFDFSKVCFIITSNNELQGSCGKQFKWNDVWNIVTFDNEKKVVNQLQNIFNASSDVYRKAIIDSSNPKSPFNKFVGNERAVKRLGKAAFVALENSSHECNESFALFGPASVGKTTLIRLFSQILDIPFVEITPSSVKTVSDLVAKVAAVLKEDGIDLVPYNDENPNYYCFPPCVIFLDEIHAYNKKLQQDLLKPTEKKDRILDDGKKTYDCKHVCWAVATTDRGMLVKAFDTRFTKIFLEPYTLDDIAKIIHVNFQQWSLDTCKIVAKYSGRVPREALTFANEMIIESKMNDSPIVNWEDVAKIVAKDNGIDEYGMTTQRLDVLIALGQGAMSRDNLCNITHCEIEELEKYVLPPLFSSTSDQPALIFSSPRGCKLTEAGIKELEKRNISYIKEVKENSDMILHNL